MQQAFRNHFCHRICCHNNAQNVLTCLTPSNLKNKFVISYLVYSLISIIRTHQHSTIKFVPISLCAFLSILTLQYASHNFLHFHMFYSHVQVINSNTLCLFAEKYSQKVFLLLDFLHVFYTMFHQYRLSITYINMVNSIQFYNVSWKNLSSFISSAKLIYYFVIRKGNRQNM